jgi:hypothetical protein
VTRAPPHCTYLTVSQLRGRDQTPTLSASSTTADLPSYRVMVPPYPALRWGEVRWVTACRGRSWCFIQPCTCLSSCPSLATPIDAHALFPVAIHPSIHYFIISHRVLIDEPCSFCSPSHGWSYLFSISLLPPTSLVAPTQTPLLISPCLDQRRLSPSD